MREFGSCKRKQTNIGGCLHRCPIVLSRTLILFVVPACLVLLFSWKCGALQDDTLVLKQKTKQEASSTSSVPATTWTRRSQLSQPLVKRHLVSTRERMSRTQVNNVLPVSSANELAFSNQTGVVIPCAVARELRRLMASADLVAARRQRTQVNVTPTFTQPDVRIRWLKESGEDLELSVYSAPDVHARPTDQPANNGARLIRFVRPSDGALVFEPFRATDFRPEVHLATYRCIASSPSRGASLLGAEVRVRAEPTPLATAQIEVLDEMVLEGNSAQFKCHMTGRAREQFFVLDWLETTANGVEILHTFQSTSQAFLQQASQNGSISRHFFLDKNTGDLHIIGVDLSLNYHTFRCRCKSRLSSELLVVSNRGQLVVTESRTPVAPHLNNESPLLMATHEEGELALLACSIQSHPRPQFTWFKRQSSELRSIGTSEGGSQQVGSLLLLRRVSRNDSGVYVCVAKNEAGEERAELELTVRARLRARLTSSATVLERGKSIALDCSVSGFPINQLVFVHNQNVIKSVGMESIAAAIEGVGQSGGELTNYRDQASRHRQVGQVANYFVVDETHLEASEQSSTGRQPDELDYIGSTELAESSLGAAKSDPSSPSGNLSSLVTKQQTQLSHVIVIVLEPQHAGAYQCFANNQYESVQSSAYIRVLEDPPKFKDTFKSEVFERGQDISLLCSAGANPLPEIRWSVDEQQIPESDRTKLGDFVTKDNLLISYVNISQAQVTDGGLYRCTADNGLAQVSHQALVSVAGEPVVKQMANQTVVAGTTMQARCPVAGYPLLEVHWAHNGRRLPTNHRQRVLANGTLLVDHMEKVQGDQGEYACIVRSPAGETAKGSFQVSIKARPSIEPFSLGKSLREGQRASIMCTISSGDLPITISWFRNDQPITSDNTGATSGDNDEQITIEQQAALRGVRVSRVSDYSSTLLFESLLSEHTANYTCVARNDAGQVSHQAPMVVQVAPKWAVEPADTNVVRGGSASVHCAASGFPAPRITWTKAGDAQTHKSAGNLQQPGSWRPIVSSPHLQVFESGALNILDARDSDYGLYMCQANNGVGPGLSKVVRVTINEQTTASTTTATLSCSPRLPLNSASLGTSLNAARWQAQSTSGHSNSNLLLPSLTAFGSPVAAQFSGRHALQYANQADSTQLKCQAKGDWPIQIRWLKNKARLEPINVRESPGVPARQTSVASVLLAPNNDSWTLREQHKSAGLLMQRYTLTTSELALTINRAAAEQTDLQASQLGPTEAGLNLVGAAEPSAAAQVPLVVQLTSVLTIGQLERQDTGTFKCLASNSFGQDEKVIQLIVQEQPSRIDELTAMEAASRSITLAWLTPYDGQAPLLAYHIYYRPELAPAAGNKQHLRVGPVDNPASLDWFNYTLPVSDGPPYNAVAGQQAVQTEAAKDGQLALASSVEPSRQLALPPPGERPIVKFTLTNLRPITSYWFQVRAENKLGIGPTSNTLQASTLEEAPGSAPTKLKVVPQSSSSILVSWSKLSDKETYGPVHGYYVAYKPLLEPTANNSASEQQHTNIYKTIQHDDKLTKFDALLTGLKRSTKYAISVQAFNARGTGPSTEPTQVRTLDTDPPKQVKLFIKHVTNCSIQLEWRPLSQSALKALKSLEATAISTEKPDMDARQLPVAMPLSAPQASLIDSSNSIAADLVDYYSLYQAEWSEQPHWQEIRLPGYTNSHTLDNLRCGTRYQFYMMGVNKIGVGDQSDILDTKTNGGIPVAPAKHLLLDVFNTTCYIVRLDRWYDNGCSITDFTVRYRADTARDWIVLADTNLAMEKQESTESASAPFEQVQPENLAAWPSKRTRRSPVTDESSYLAVPSSLEDEPIPDDDAFLDYATDLASDYNVPIHGQPESRSSNNSQLINLLKDSMLSSFESPSYNQQFNLRTSLFTAESKEPKLVQIEHQARTASELKRIRLCNLSENIYYMVRISAENSVGLSESEVRLLTSKEGLEFDPETKRHVIGRLGGSNLGRAAQSVVATGDKFSIFTIAGLQWPIIVPITFLIALTTVIATVMLLLRRSSSSSSSTSTTLSNHHCSAASSYAHDSPPSHQHISVDAMCTIRGQEDIDAFTEGRSSASGPTLKSTQQASNHMHEAVYSPNVGIYGQHQQRLGACQLSHGLDETHYGMAAPQTSVDSYPVGSYPLAGELASASNYTSSSSATTAATLSASSHSASSGSAGGGSLKPPSSGVFIRTAPDFGGHQQAQQQQQASSGPPAAQRGGRVYLCTKPVDMVANVQAKADGSTYYGLDEQTSELGLIYGPTVTQLRQIQQQQAGTLQKVEGDISTAKMDNNCFLTIVEEVARADETYTGNQTKNYDAKSDPQGCNHQLDCMDNTINQFNQQCQLATNFAANVNFEHEREAELHQADGATNRLMYDPVYSTIRRNFPQAFRYLTLQQQPSSVNAELHSKISDDKLAGQRNRPPFTDPIESSILNSSEIFEQGQNQQQLGHDMSLFNSNNLAALNLLTTNNSANNNGNSMRLQRPRQIDNNSQARSG